MAYPSSAEEFALLQQHGKTVEIAETPSVNTVPAGEGWEFWAERKTDDTAVAVWRRIVPLS